MPSIFRIFGQSILRGDATGSGNALTVSDSSGTARLTIANQGRITLGQDAASTISTAATITTDVVGAFLVLRPNGTGGIIAAVPDNTATGGNARGTNSVDLQISRAAATQVASGNNSFIGCGQNNTLSGSQSVIVGGTGNSSAWNLTFIGGGQNHSIGAIRSSIVGGEGNSIGINSNGSFIGGGQTVNVGGNAQFSVAVGGSTINANGTYSVVVGGQSNTASGAHSFIGGGQSNTASGTHSTIAGGQSNTASATNTFAAGFTNTASGNYAVAIGRQNTASGVNSVSLGSNSTASGVSSVALGYSNEAITENSIALGFNGRAYNFGQFSRAAGNFSNTENIEASVQQTNLILYKSVTGITAPTASELFLNGTTERAILALPTGAINARVWTALIQVVAVVNTVGTGTVLLNDVFSGLYQCTIKRALTTTSMVGSVSPVAQIFDTSMSSSVITIDADDTNEALRIQFTPPTTAAADTVIRVVATVYLTEVGQ